MPLFDFHCTACEVDFELLVRGDTTPVCPQCGSAAVEKRVSRIAPAGKIESIRMAHRRAADAAGMFSNYTPSERARLLKGKNV